VRLLGSAVLILGLGMAGPSWSQDERSFDQVTRPSDYKLRKTERLHVDDVYAGRDGERQVETYVRALTRYGEPVLGLRRADFQVREDGNTIESEDLEAVSLRESGRGITVVLALDNSRTMEGDPFDRAREAAHNFLRLLSSRDKIAIVSFAGAPEIVAGFDEGRSKVEALLRATEIEPNSLNTTLYDAIYKSVELIRKSTDLPRRSLVVVFSDGNDGGSNHSLEQALALASGSETEPRVLVFSIGYARFGSGGMEVLERLAKETGADARRADSTAQLNTFYTDILTQMMESYVLTFPADLDGEAHTVEVVVEGLKDQRRVLYPDLPRPLWPWLVGAGSLVLVALGVWLARNVRSPGRLVFIDGPKSGEVVQLRQGRMRIGSLDDNDVVIEISTVSRYHAEVLVKGRDIELEDLRSRNGTLVNGAPIRRTPLHPGDRINIADVGLRFER
jgi:VWFA-related protein